MMSKTAAWTKKELLTIVEETILGDAYAGLSKMNKRQLYRLAVETANECPICMADAPNGNPSCDCLGVS